MAEEFHPNCGTGHAVDPADMAEINRLIAARIKVSRATVEAKRVEGPGGVLRRVIEGER